MTTEQRRRAWLTGGWLALTQVALALSLLESAGAAARAFFALTAVWLLGGTVGALSAARLPERPLLTLSLLLFTASRLASALWPFSLASSAALLCAGLCGGLYAGHFLAGRARLWGAVRELLLRENNGFVAGYLVASLLVLTARGCLDALALTLGGALLFWGRLGPRLPLALLVAALAAAAYVLFPYCGDRGWDALMTASVLRHPDQVSLRELFFFAHPLVIPLTWPARHLTADPLAAAALRESLAAGGVAGLALLGAWALTGRWLAGILAAAGLTLAASRWQLATSGEEKEISLLFAGSFLWLYLDHRGLWNLGLPGWRQLSRGVRRLLLGFGLALAAAVHLGNGLLVLVVLTDALIGALIGRDRDALIEAVWVLAGAALFAGPFFVWLAVGPGGARTLPAIARHFLEYHLSGDYFVAPRSAGAALLAAYGGGRTWLLGDLLAPPGWIELAAAAASALWLLWHALRNSAAPQAATRIAVWLALLAAHFFFYEPWLPEAWGLAGLAWAVLVSAGLLAQPGRSWPLGLAGAALGLLLAGHVQAQRAAAAEVEAAAQGLALPSLDSVVPMAQLARYIDAELPRDALLLVDAGTGADDRSHDRLAASYFHIYTGRRPIVLPYLDQTPDELRQRFHLTSLSLAFYTPPLTRAQLAASGRPLYLLTSRPLAGVQELFWDGLRFGRVALP